MPITETPLRYPGGKTQLTPFVIDLMRVNHVLNGVYAEPFAGGAGLAWRLLLNGHACEVWLNDIDPAVHAFWYAVLHQTDALCNRIEKAVVDMPTWQTQRKRLLARSGRPLDLAFATLFLNRTNRSGILHGGVIGGKDQTGNYKLDCRFNKSDLIRRIQRIALYREQVHLQREDAANCIATWARRMPKCSLMNIDPPYFAQGSGLYTNFYRPDDHASLATAIRRLKCNWMLTYDDAPEIAALYSGLPIYRKSLVYYAQVKRRASELLVLAPHLSAPSALAGQLAA